MMDCTDVPMVRGSTPLTMTFLPDDKKSYQSSFRFSPFLLSHPFHTRINPFAVSCERVIKSK